jgi:glycerol-1-phosphate dehydrogenase [NAD(P)+]
MPYQVHIDISTNAIQNLVQYCKNLTEEQFTIISDTNTYAALGERVRNALIAADLPVTNIVLEGEEIVSDEVYLTRALVQSSATDQVFVAVGSGTLTDIARYISYRTRNRFIAVPSAPSVDGFVSPGAPLVVGGIKETYPARPPIAVFADLATLTAAPTELKAAGVGDIIGKTTSLADWKLAHLLWDTPHDAAVEQRIRQAVQNCIDGLDEIVANSETGMACLMEALIESGLGMLEFGNSQPASGSEHHCSHFWELQLLKAHKPAILHGAKVGFATILISKQYERLRHLARTEVSDMLEAANLREAGETVNEIRQSYDQIADDVIRIQAPFLEMTDNAYRQLKTRILESWSAVQEIADTVLAPAEITEILMKVGSPVNEEQLGIEQVLVKQALLYGHYLRDRFTVLKLFNIMGIEAMV